jgi:hypothetical protein
VTAGRFLECRSFENPYRILKVDVMLGEVGLALALVPLEKHVYGSRSINIGEYQSMHRMYIRSVRESKSRGMESWNPRPSAGSGPAFSQRTREMGHPTAQVVPVDRSRSLDPGSE